MSTADFVPTYNKIPMSDVVDVLATSEEEGKKISYVIACNGLFFRDEEEGRLFMGAHHAERVINSFIEDPWDRKAARHLLGIY